MSIAPPSDIVLDVAQAADPQRLQAATAKLNGLAAGAGGTPADFASLLDAAAPVPRTSGTPAPMRLATPSATMRPAASPYRKFEAVLLQTMVQEILPKDNALFGDAASGDICRSMLAEQIALQLAKSGSFGIARMVETAEHARHGAAASPGAQPKGTGDA